MPSLTTNQIFRKLDHSSLIPLSSTGEKIRAYKVNTDRGTEALEVIRRSIEVKKYNCTFSLDPDRFQENLKDCQYLVRVGKVLTLCYQIENLDYINPPEEFFDHITGNMFIDPVRCHMGHIFSNIDVCRAFISDKNRCLYCEHHLTLEQLTPVIDLADRIKLWKKDIYPFLLAKYTNQQLSFGIALEHALSKETDLVNRINAIMLQIQKPSRIQLGRFEEILLEASECMNNILYLNELGSEYVRLHFYKPVKILTWNDYEKIESLPYEKVTSLINQRVDQLKKENKEIILENNRQQLFIISKLTDNLRQMQEMEAKACEMIAHLKEDVKILEEIKNEYQRKRVEASKKYDLDQQEIDFSDSSVNFEKFRLSIEEYLTRYTIIPNDHFLETRSKWHAGSALINDIKNLIDNLNEQIKSFEKVYDLYKSHQGSTELIAKSKKSKLEKLINMLPDDLKCNYLYLNYELLIKYAYLKDKPTEFSDRIDSFNIRISNLLTSTGNDFFLKIKEIEKRLKDFNDCKNTHREKLIEALNVREIHKSIYHQELMNDLEENRKTAASIDKALQELDKSLSFQESLLSIQNYFRGFVHQLTIGFISPPKLSTPVGVSLGNNIENGFEDETKKQIITRIDLDIKNNKKVEEANKAKLLFWGNIFTSVAAVKYPLLIGILGVKNLGLLCLSYKLANDRYKRALETLGLNEVERSEDIVEAYLSKSKEMHGGFDQDSSQEYGKYELAAAAMYLHTYKKIPFNLTKSRELQVFSTIYVPYQDTITGDSKSLRAISYDAISVGASLATRCAVNNFSKLKASTSASPKLLKK